jgi:outer membrane protein OmpA-like peptidoglycan-associated protein
MLNMFGGFGGMMPSLTGTAGGTPAPSIYASGLPIPGFGPGPNPYLANAQGAPAPAAPSLPSIFPFGAPAPSLANAQAAPAAPSFFPAGAPAKMTLSGDALFRSGKASTRDLTAEGKKGLNELADKIKAAGKIDTIRVTGHADKTGKASYNMNLSLARARSVADYLKSKGVKAAKFITAGKGDTQPVKDCDMKLPKAELVACLQPNRRVEIEVVPAK